MLWRNLSGRTGRSSPSDASFFAVRFNLTAADKSSFGFMADPARQNFNRNVKGGRFGNRAIGLGCLTALLALCRANDANESF